MDSNNSPNSQVVNDNFTDQTEQRAIWLRNPVTQRFLEGLFRLRDEKNSSATGWALSTDSQAPDMTRVTMATGAGLAMSIDYALYGNENWKKSATTPEVETK